MLPIKIDHLEFYVFNALQAANFYKSSFGFKIIAYAGPDTGMKDKISYILKHGSITLVVSSAVDPDSDIIKHVIKHDDSVKDIVFMTGDVHTLFEHSIKNGAIPIMPPTIIEDGDMSIIKATIASFGDVVHSLIQRQDLIQEHDRDILPFYKFIHKTISLPQTPKTTPIIDAIDHLAIAVGSDSITKWQKFYQDVFGFHLFYSEDIDLGKSGMRSLVTANETENIKLVFVEPISKQEKSQIDNYLSYNNGEGVQHLAFLSSDIICAIKYLQTQGINFLNVPASYYSNLDNSVIQRLGPQKISDLQELNILVDAILNDKENKILMQAFTKPLQNRPTFFTEIIQRDKADGFGSKNIKALYEAVQQEQNKLHTQND